MNIKKVSSADCGRLQGTYINQLEEAVKSVCPGPLGAGIWGDIFRNYSLGFVNCEQWVNNMNIAIGIWNESDPKTCEEIKKTFGV